MGLEIVDAVMESIHIVCPELIRRHRKFFNDLCDSYHKPNPVHMLSDKHFAIHFKSNNSGKTFHQWQASFCSNPKSYTRGGCRMFKMMRKAITEQLELQIERYKKAQKVLTWQWFEVIDFMYERPELVNPAMLDEYIQKKINDVCETNKKNNPLSNGMMSRFGKFWKDGDGKWRTERRKRF